MSISVINPVFNGYGEAEQCPSGMEGRPSVQSISSSVLATEIFPTLHSTYSVYLRKKVAPIKKRKILQKFITDMYVPSNNKNPTENFR